MGNWVILGGNSGFPHGGGGDPLGWHQHYYFANFSEKKLMESRKIWFVARILLHTFNDIPDISMRLASIAKNKNNVIESSPLGQADSLAVYFVNKDYQISLVNTVNYKYGLGGF